MRKHCWKKLVQKFELVRTAVDITLSEVKLLVEESELLEYSIPISHQLAQNPPHVPLS